MTYFKIYVSENLETFIPKSFTKLEFYKLAKSFLFAAV